jgi:sulfur carrier protein ThiS
MNFEKYIGIPFLEKGRDESGVDCWGLVRLIYKQEYNINLPSFVEDYELSDDARIGELFAQYKEGWTPLTQPTVGCVVLFRMFGTESHIGIVVDNSHFIHVREGRDSVIESLESAKWSKRIVGYYNYSEGANAVLNAVPHPLKTERYLTTIVPGTRVSELVLNICEQHNIEPELKSRISVLVNGVVVPQESWATRVIQLGDAIEYRAVPGKEALRVVAVIAIAWYAPIIATQMLQAAAVAGVSITAAMGYGIYFGTMAAVHLIGGALINAIAPIRPPSDPRDPANPGVSVRQEMIAGGQNRGNPYGSIPVVLGKLRITPLLGSNNYLSFENERDSFLSMLLVWGYGPLNIDSNTLRIGGVPADSYPKPPKIVTLDRKTEHTPGQLAQFNSLYGQDYSPAIQPSQLFCDGNPQGTITGYNTQPVYDWDWETMTQIQIGTEQVPIYQLPVAGPWVTASTNVEVDVATGLPVPVTQVRVDLHFPQGLRYIATKGENAGNSYATGVEFRVEYSINNGVSYTYLDIFTVGGDTPKKDAFTFTKSYTFNVNQLAIRIRRQTGDNVEDNPERRYYFDSILQNVTFVRNTSPAVDPVGAKIAKTAFKIQASEQLNGSIQGISAIVQTWCKIWNGSAWVDGATSNPAALMRYVLEHPANPRRVTNASTQINLTQLQYFYNYCQTKGFEYNNVLTSARSILEVLRDICAAGRASPALVDGKWSVIIDEPRTNIVQHFTPHNSWGFEGNKGLPKRPDGLRVTYYDEEQDYQEAEIIVYDIGKGTNNATLFESITLPGVTKKSLVIDHAKWHMAQMKARPEVYVLNADLEYLVCNRGDRVKVVHDVPMWGLGSGRVKNRVSTTQLELDEAMPMVANASYTIRFRSKTGASVARNVVAKTQDGLYNNIQLSAAVTVDEADAGDLFLFGELNQESQDLIVLSIEPATNNSARITLVDYGVTSTYNIFTDYISSSASIVFESQISLPQILQRDTFGDKVPTITGFVSDESVMEAVAKGVFKYNINVAYVNSANLPSTTEHVQAEYELNDSTTSIGARIVIVPVQKGSLNLPDVVEGSTYKIRLRYVGSAGTTGKWTAYSTHTVVGKINPPSQVTGFQVVVDKLSGQLKLSWDANPEPDTYTYEVRRDNIDWGFNNSNRIFLGDSVGVFSQYVAATPTTYYIKAVDSSGNYSVTASSATFTLAAVPNITSLTHSYYDTSLTNATVILTWSEAASPQFDVAYYEITYLDGAENVLKTVKSNTITLPANWVGNRDFTVKTVDIHGNKSSGYVANITKLPPNPVTGYRAQVIDNNVLLYWTNGAKTSLPIAHVLLKKSGPDGTWATATVVGTKSGEFTSISELSGGDYIYWLAAVDTDDVESVPVEIPVTVSQPPDFKFIAEFISTLTPGVFNPSAQTTSIISNNIINIPKISFVAGEQVIYSSGGGTAIGGLTNNSIYYIKTSVNGGIQLSTSLGGAVIDLTSVGTGTAHQILHKDSSYEAYAGELFLPVSKVETWTQHFTSRTWAGPSAQVAAGYPVFIQPGVSSGFYEEIFDAGTIIASSQITLNSIETDVVGSTTSSTVIYVSTDGVTYSIIGSRSGFATNFRYIKIRIEVSQNTVGSIRKIGDLRVRLDTKQKSESDYVTVPVAGKLVNFDSEFIDVQSIILTASGSSTSPIISVYDFKDIVITGTYSVVSNVATINATGHGLIAGQKVRLYFTTGTGISGLYIIQTVINANSYTVNMITPNTGGNVTTYPNSMIIYSFTSNTGVAVASTTSYQIKGY